MPIKDTQTDHEQKIAALLGKDVDDSNLAKEQRDKQKRTNQTFSYGGASKRKFVVEESNWGGSLEERRSNDYEIGAQGGEARDKFRDAAGKYWGYDKDDGASQSVVYISKDNWANAARHVPFNMTVSEPLYNASPEKFAGDRNPFFEVTQAVRLTADKGQFTDANGNYRSDNWYTLMKGVTGDMATGNSGIITENVDYNYLAFDMNLPFNYSDLDNLNLAGPQYAKIRPEYNFYIKEYEEMMRFGAGINESETMFPNLYALMLEKINEVSNPIFSKHLSLAGAIKETGGFFGPTKFDIKKHSGQYFDLFGRGFAKASVDTIRQWGSKYKNVIVPIDNVPLLKEISDKKELFPMFVDIEFSTDKMTEFAQMLSDTTLTNDFMWAMVKDVVNSKGHRNVNFMEALEISSVEVHPDGTSTVSKTTRTNRKARKVWDVFDWIKNSSLVSFDHGGAIPMTEDVTAREFAARRSVFLDDGSYSAYDEVNPQNKFFRSLLGVIFVGKLKTFLKNRTRTYAEIIEGHPCHSESVLYRVEKSLANGSGNPTGDAIQSFWFPNTNQIDVLRFVDTQIKYKKKYAYRIYAYQLAVNTKYSYSQSEVWDDGASFVVTQKPEVLLIEQEIFADSHVIVDDPPIPPEIEIVPYFGEGRKILFNLNNAVGEYIMDPIPISQNDVADHAEIRHSQKVAPGEPIRFKGDDPIGKQGYFEIYRMETPPSGWTDFDGNLLATIANNSKYGSTETLSASSAEYIDSISSNKKYYYTCRTIDAHGHTSNPSPIYEIELVNDEGSIYMTKRVVDFLPREPKLPTKGMRRLLLIRPLLEQTFIDDTLLVNVDSAFDVKNVKLGGQGISAKILQESPWGKKFKFRLVSRKTGKKMDFNVDFKAIMERKSTLK